MGVEKARKEAHRYEAMAKIVKVPRSWWVAASLFVILLTTFGTVANTVGVFVPELTRQFGWGRGQVSLLTSTIALAAAASAFPVGWLLDRIEAKFVIVGGTAAAVAGYVLASRAEDFTHLLVAHILLGVCIIASGTGTAALVIANWFDTGQGTALAITVSGTSVGGLLSNLLVSRVIARWGWRTGYLTLALPMLVLAIPLALIMVRTRPPSYSPVAKKLSVRESGDLLPGLELSEALRSRSFWLLVIAAFFWAFSTNATETHTIPLLIGFGYKLRVAASAFSLLFPSVIAGKLILGVWSDRVSGRVAFGTGLLLQGAGFFALLYLGSYHPLLIPAVMALGFAGGAPLALLPKTQVESLGLKRFGSIGGVIAVTTTIGAAMGPAATGYLFDATGSYAFPWQICAAVLFIAGLAAFHCAPISFEVVPVIAEQAESVARP